MKIQRLIGICLLIFILFQMDWRQASDIIHQINPLYMAFALANIVVLIGLKSWRWKSILTGQGIHLSFGKAFEYYACSIFLGVATPGRIGELGRAFFLSQSGKSSLPQGVFSVIADRLFDVYFFLLISLLGMAALDSFTVNTQLVWIGVIVALLFPAMVFLRNTFGLNRLFTAMLCKLTSVLRMDIAGSWRSDKPFAAKYIVYAAILSICSGAVYFFQCYVIAKALALPFSYAEIAFIISITTLVSLLPITIMGLGTRESVLLFLMMPFNLSQETILA